MFEQFLSNFSGGEVSEDIYGRYESELYKNSLKRCENFISLIQGPVEYRGGTSYVHATRLQQEARQERFRFNDEQTYILEFTTGKLRIYEDAGLTLVTSSQTITGITNANPGVITSVGHGYATDDEIRIVSVGGMTELNGKFFRVVKINNDTCSLKDLFGTAINTTSFTAYTSGGSATKVFELTSPYLSSDLFKFQFDQEGNVAYFVHRSYAPYKLTRVSSTSWTFATYSRTADPFTGADLFPGAVNFYEGCIYFASSNTYPDRLWRSRGPDETGATRYDDFTTGSDADHAIITSVSTGTGDIAYIHWLAGLQKFMAIGTEGGVLGLDGGGDFAITPDNYRIRPIDPVGVQGIMPVINGQSIFYMQKGSRILRSFDYDLVLDNYRSTDRQFVASHLTRGGIKQLAIQRWKTDLLWAVRNDGVLLSLTIKPKEDVSGWHRHTLGNVSTSCLTEYGQVLSISVEARVDGYDRLYLVVQRTINGITTAYNEYMNDPYEGVQKEDYFTSEDEEIADLARYLQAVFTALRSSVYLDATLSYNSPITITDITLDDPILVTAPSHGLSNGDQIRLDNIVGTWQLNGKKFIIGNVTTHTFTLTSEVT
jgi:hypothetical protein